ncbi:MAG: DUF4906 domain-containing protein [Bacteroidales bacterium]|nr:DUF4906 domain-containing protein [Candidatus Hennigimonas equi]
MRTKPFIISIITGMCVCSCDSGPAFTAALDSTLHIGCSVLDTRAGTVEEDTIWDVNVFVLGYGGIPEQHRFIRYPDGRKGGTDVDVSLLANREYTIYAFANAGYDMGFLDGDRLEGFRFHLQHPDMVASGIPMSGKSTYIASDDGDAIRLELKRLASKVTVRLDRSLLDDDVDFHIAGVKVGNSPRWVQAYSPSAILSGDDSFPAGYYSRGDDVTELYLLENLQGNLNPDLCSYIEIDIDYNSDRFYTDGKNGLIYRFYLREGHSYMVQRNCHYTVTICPEKDGLLCEDSWRVDRSHLIPAGNEAFLKISPEGSTIDGTYYDRYYEIERGGSIHFGLSYAPKNMTVTLREDLVEDELEDGRAEYTMDADGRGFTMRSIGGNGLSMMEIVAGAPLNDSETIAVYIN